MTLLKKAGALFLALLLTLSLTACRSTAAPESSAAEVSAETSSETSSEVSGASSSEEEAAGGAADADTGSDSIYSAALDAQGCFKDVIGADYVALPDYKSIEIPEDVSTVTDQEYAQELDSRLSAFTTQEHVTDRAIVDGDTVNIDYVGSVDGVEFAGGNTNGAGTTVTIGVTSYIDDFLEQLIGHRAGDTFDVNVTFPDPYPNNQDLAGKDAVFVTTINYIVEEVTPSLTDEFVAENWQGSEGWSTVAEAEAGIREELRQTAVANYLWNEIQTQAEVREVPAAITQYQEDVLIQYYTAMAESYDMELADFLTDIVGVSGVNEILEQSRAQLDENARASLILQALSQDLGIQVTDEDITYYFENNMNVSDWTSFLPQYGRPYLALLAREDLTKRQLGMRS